MEDVISASWDIAGFDRRRAVELCHRGVNPLVAVILASRGVTSEREAAEFSGEGPALSDPMLLRDMDKAAARVRRAIDSGEHVAVFGDYDVDGITASCLMADFLRKEGLSCDIYIPERLGEGYGINSAALEGLRRNGVSLIITVDCGITAAEEARFAKGLGLDMVITDHHEQSATLPEAVAVVDPCRPDCPSPAKCLAGVGVAFKLACAVAGPARTGELLERYSDLVATGTVADVMPVTGENRALIRRGLVSLREGRRPGFSELCAAAGIDSSRLSVSNIGYGIAPRINAAGRIGDTGTAVSLLLTTDRTEAAELAASLCALNRERQRMECEMLEEALRMLENDPPDGKPIVLKSASWHQGVAGIVASRLADRFCLPSVVVCVKDGVGRGSCRSVEGFNLHEALSRSSGLLLSFGGHEMAAGLTVREEDIPALRSSLAESFSPDSVSAERRLRVDLEVTKPELLSLENVTAMTALEPYGIGNPQPVLCIKNGLIENVTPLSEGRHTKLWLKKGGESFECVFFSHSPESIGARPGVTADVAFTPQINEFRGRRSVQLYLAGIITH